MESEKDGLIELDIKVVAIMRWGWRWIVREAGKRAATSSHKMQHVTTVLITCGSISDNSVFVCSLITADNTA